MKTDKEYLINNPAESLLPAYIRGNVSAEEKKQVEDWIKQDESNEKVLNQIAYLYYAQQKHERILARNPNKAYEKVQSKRKQKAIRIRFERFAWIAASFIGAIILSYSYIMLSGNDGIRSLSEKQEITIMANAGMRSHFNLPDGTKVYLNSGSSLTYDLPFNHNERKVALNGEAYFEVVSNLEQPFYVQTMQNLMDIKVTGTIFNIEAYEKEHVAYTTLVKGQVSLLVTGENGIQSEYRISPNERVTYNIEDKQISSEQIDSELEIAWINGQVKFRNTPLPEVLRKLSHFYDIEFEIRDKIIETYLFTGTFDNRQIDQVLEYLKLTSKIDYELIKTTTDDSISIQKRKVILKNKK